MNNFGYEYFCGANVVVEIEGMPVLECAGIRVSLMESKRPIYGYSSRFYDAVAHGQVLVEGSLLINYVHNDYLWEAIQLGLEKAGLIDANPNPLATDTLGSGLINAIQNETNSRLLINRYAEDPIQNAAVAEALQRRFWDLNSLTPDNNFSSPLKFNPNDLNGTLDIRVTFGNKEIYNFGAGVTHFIINYVTFLGRAKSISIDEQVIVEEYPFFARNITSKPQILRSYIETEGNEEVITLE